MAQDLTKHDEVRQILHETGFKFDDGRSVLDMTDEEVDRFLVIFMANMTELARQMTQAFKPVIAAFNNAAKPLQNVTRMLAEMEKEKKTNADRIQH